MLKVSAEACRQMCQETVFTHCFKIYSEKFNTAFSSVHITANIYGIHFFPLKYLKSCAGFILGGKKIRDMKSPGKQMKRGH